MKKQMSLKNKRALAGYGFIAPFVIGVLLIFGPSIVKAVVFSLSDIIMNTDGSGYTLEWVGLTHYNTALRGHAWYFRELMNTFWRLIYNVPLVIAFSFFIAGILNKDFKGRTFVRAILFLPVVISAGIMSSVDNVNSLSEFAQSDQVSEAINAIDITNFIVNVGIPNSIVNVITTSIARIYEVITSSGVQILIFLAALQSISPSLYEASTMEGATGWENFWKITFPMLSPYILVCAVYTVIDLVSSFKSPVMKVIDSVANSSLDNRSLSIAMAFIFFAMAAVILGAFVLLISRMVFYYD